MGRGGGLLQQVIVVQDTSLDHSSKLTRYFSGVLNSVYSLGFTDTNSIVNLVVDLQAAAKLTTDGKDEGTWPLIKAFES